MEGNMSISEMEQNKIDEINAMLPTLLKKGLLTDIECRLIVSSKKPLEKVGGRGAVYKVIRSRTIEEAFILKETFGMMTLTDIKKKSKGVYTSYSNEEITYCFLPSKNPFVNNAIIKHLFGFLPLDDMKECRLVCRQWNSTAEICLRKRSTICFCPNGLLPNAFIKVSKYSLPDLPFSSFEFTSNWQISDIQEFFVNWGNNIKEMTFNNVKLARKCNFTNNEVLIWNYDVTPLFINPSNITVLKILNLVHYMPNTILNISLEKFVSIKTLSLQKCRIIVPAEKQKNLIAPVNINFQDLSVVRNREISKHFQYNDFVDFTMALNVYLKQKIFGDTDALLEMSHQVFNAKTLHLENKVSLKNFAQAKGDVHHLTLEDIPFVEKNHLKIKKLESVGSKINLSVLPQTLEILKWSSCEIFCSEPFTLPNLKYLHINVENISSLESFSNCANLKELAIDRSGDNDIYKFSVCWVPKTVKRMSIVLSQIEFVDNYTFELDTLILHCFHSKSSLTDCIAITAQIKAKVLVVHCGKVRDIDNSDVVKLVIANQQSEKIIIGSKNLHGKTPFEGSDLSKCVDKKSNFYQFENQVGKSITQEEFERYALWEDNFPSFFWKSL